jgi:hypothetical protein
MLLTTNTSTHNPVIVTIKHNALLSFNNETSTFNADINDDRI